MVKKKTIMVTNDDGIRAEGLSALIESIDDFGRILVIAPEQEQSASSHSITLDKPLRIKKYSNNKFGVSGTPADCVLLLVHGILDKKPDLIVSGINHGPNMGEDVIYSGTVAAAIEGSILGIPSLAISVASWDFLHFEASAKISRYIVRRILELEKENVPLWNVNIPPLPENEINGIKITKLGSRVYHDIIVKNTDPRGKDYYWIGGGKPGWNSDEDSDFSAVSRGYVSISPMHFDLTDYKSVLELKRIDFRWEKG
jgi:5'-nucleotidase